MSTQSNNVVNPMEAAKTLEPVGPRICQEHFKDTAIVCRGTTHKNRDTDSGYISLESRQNSGEGGTRRKRLPIRTMRMVRL
jgi:hypothetical protein